MGKKKGLEHIRHWWLIILIVLSLGLLTGIPAIDALVMSKLNQPSASPQVIQANSTTNVDDQDNSNSDAQISVSSKEEKLKSYQRILDTIKDISIPLISIIVPVVAFAVPLFNILIKEKNQRLENLYCIVRRMFSVGTRIVISNEWYDPRLVTDNVDNSAAIFSFEMPISDEIIFPGIGLNIVGVQAEFFEAITTQTGKRSYKKQSEEKNYTPELRFSLSLCDSNQQKIAMRLLSPQEFPMGCFLELHMEFDSWQELYYDVTVSFQIKKTPEKSGNVDTGTAFCEIKQLSSIKITEYRKEK